MVLNISELIKKRIELGISQTELANIIGIHQGNLSRIESGKIDCKMSSLELLDAGLEIIKENQYRKVTGIIVIDETDFKNILFNSMISNIENRLFTEQNTGTAKQLTEELVNLIIKKVCKTDVI